MRTATLLTKNTGDITEAILRFVLHFIVVTLACSGIYSVTHITFELTLANASAAISSANVGWKYIEIIPRQFYEAKRLFLSIHVAVLATYGWFVRF